VIRVRRYFDDGTVQESVDPEEVSECLGHRGSLVWVDVVDPTADDVSVLAEEFGVHHLAAEDILEPAQRPRLGRFSDHFFMVVREPCIVDCGGEDPRFASREIDLVFSDGWLITVRKRPDNGHSDRGPGEPMPIDEFIGRFDRLRTSQGSTDEGFLLYAILDTVVDRCFVVADAFEDRLDEIERDIFGETRGHAHEATITERLYHLRGDFVLFRRAVAPLREAIAPLLRNEDSDLEDRAVVYLRDVLDLAIRATEAVDSLRDLLNGALEAHLSITSNRMNLVMKQATSWGAILVGNTLVAGIYGMNFDHMPELHWLLGYPFALGMMAIISLALYWRFKRQDWL
jgi:magnesium transporter